MGRNKNKKKNKRNYRAKLASNERETTVQSTSKASEVKTDGNNFMNGNIAFDIQTKSNYLHEEFQEKKDAYISRYDFEAAGQNLRISKSDFDEAINKFVHDIIELLKADKWFCEMSHLKNKDLKLYKELNIRKLNSVLHDLNKLSRGMDPVFLDFMEHYMNMQAELSFLLEKTSSVKEEIYIAKYEAYGEMMKSREQGDTNAQNTASTELECGPNKLIFDLETGKKNKNTIDCDISADYIQKADHTTHNIEDKKEGNEATGCTKKERYSMEKIEMKNTAKRISPQKPIENVNSTEEIPRDLTGILTLQNIKIEEKMKDCSAVESKTNYLKEKLNLLSSEKGNVTSPGEAGKRREPKVYTIEVSPTIEQNHNYDEEDMPSNKIHFEFHTNGIQFFEVYGEKGTYYLKENEKIILNFKNEKAQVSFYDGQIFVSTPNYEFDISVRKPEPDNLTNKTHLIAKHNLK